MTVLNFDSAAFLQSHWQKEPLLIRQGLKHWSNPLEPDELAGLACEEGIESRLVVGGDGHWSVEHGPITPDRFDTIGSKDWSLLVQAVDHHVPEVSALLELFRFIPNWRIDDVMVSFAADGGGVGPHFDQYDVFLIQGSGKRRWQVGDICDATSALMPHDDLKLLADFTVREDWVLEPGDILYVPPGIAHNGIAVGEGCMTYSIGFRAPSRSELIGGWMDELVAEMDEDDRYSDPDLLAQDNSGEITAQAIDRLHRMIIERVGNRDAFTRWFGETGSDRKYPEIDWQPDLPASSIQSSAGLIRNPASRFAFVEQPDGVTLFVDGESFDCTGRLADFARVLCGQDCLTLGPDLAADDAVRALALRLVNQGSIALAQDD